MAVCRPSTKTKTIWEDSPAILAKVRPDLVMWRPDASKVHGSQGSGKMLGLAVGAALRMWALQALGLTPFYSTAQLQVNLMKFSFVRS